MFGEFCPILDRIFHRSRLTVGILGGKLSTAVLTAHLSAQVSNFDLCHSTARRTRSGKEGSTAHFTSPFVNEVSRARLYNILVVSQNYSEFA